MNSDSPLRQAKLSDTSAIADLLAVAPFVYRHLDWRPVLEWLPKEPFILQENENRLTGFLACPPDLEKIAWIRAFACSANADLKTVWRALFDQTTWSPVLRGHKLLSIGLCDWFAELLVEAGFHNFQNVVVLSWNHHLATAKPMRPDCLIRPMEENDIEAVGELDRRSFEPVWVTPADALAMAYTQSEHASVAEINGKVVGYELSTANHFAAHLARVAIDPDFQRDHIAYNMLIEMIKYFDHKGIHQITVNTQDNNSSSLSLYNKLGFYLTGDTYPVFEYEI